MRSFRILFVAVLVVAVLAGIAFAMKHEASVDKGKALFSDKNLGTNGKTCNDCHQNGKGMEKAGAKADLVATINKCVTQAIKGKALDEKSIEMQSMVLYIKSIGKQGKTGGY